MLACRFGKQCDNLKSLSNMLFIVYANNEKNYRNCICRNKKLRRKRPVRVLKKGGGQIGCYLAFIYEKVLLSITLMFMSLL